MANLGSLGSLFIDLAANTATFETDIGRAQKLADKQAKAMQKSFQDAAENIFAAFESFNIADKLTQSIKGSIDAMDQLGKSAQKIGIGTQRLSELKYAASLANVGFDALTLGMEKFNVAGTKAANGGKEQAAAFQAVGISLKDLKNLSPDEQLNRVADAFAGARDGADKTAIAIALFGKAGADMIPFLNQGSEAIAKASAEAAVFHQVVSDQAAKAADEFNTNLTKLHAAGSGLATLVAGDLMQALKGLTDQFLDYIKDGQNAADISNAIANAIKGIIAVALAGKIALKSFGEGLGDYAGEVHEAASKIGILDLIIPGAAIYKFAKGLHDQAPVIGAATDDIATQFKKGLDDINRILLAGTQSASKTFGSLAGNILGGDGGKRDLSFNPQGLQQAEEMAKRAKTAIDGANSQLSALENEAQGHKDIAVAVALRQKVEDGEYADLGKNTKARLLQIADEIEAQEKLVQGNTLVDTAKKDLAALDNEAQGHKDLSKAAALRYAVEQAGAKGLSDAYKAQLLQIADLEEADEKKIAADKKATESASKLIDKYGPSAKVSGRDFNTEIQNGKSVFGVQDATAGATGQENERYKAEQQAFLDSRQAILAAGGDYDKLEAAAAKAHEDELLRIKKAGIDSQVRVTQAQLGVFVGVFGDLADAQDKSTQDGFKRYKEFAIAQATISTISGAIGAFSQAAAAFPPPYGEIAGAVAAAAVTAAGFARIGQINGEQFSGRRYGGNVSAGGIYSVAEPGNPELLRYGQQTLLMMPGGGPNGIVMPAKAMGASRANAGAPSLQINNNAPGITFQPGPDGISAEMIPELRDYVYDHVVSQAGSPSSRLSRASAASQGRKIPGQR